MRTMLAGVTLVGALLLVLGSTSSGGEKKEVTLKGKITCAKCDLAKEAKCATVIVTKEDGKDVIYYLDAKSGKANHGKICNSPMDGSVTGTVSEKGGKKTITTKEGGVKFE